MSALLDAPAQEPPPGASAGAPPEPAPAGAGDAHWLAHVYQGDEAAQLTLRAVLTGGVIGMFMAIGNLYTVMKVGFGFGVAVTSCVVSYAAWGTLRALSGGRLGQLSILENNCMQTTASAAGFSTGASMCVTFAALMMLDPEHHHQPWWVVATFTFTTAMMGVLLAIPMKRLLINEERLPFPTGTAAATTLRGLYSRSHDAVRNVYAMAAGMAAGALSGVLTTAEDQFSVLGRFFEWMRMNLVDLHLPDQLPAQGFALLGGKPMYGFGFEPGLTTIGFGMIVGLRMSLSMLGSAAALYFAVAPWLQAMDAAQATTVGYVASIPTAGGGTFYHPLRWALWGGASVLVFSSLTALALQWRTVARAFTRLRGAGSLGRQGTIDARMAAIEVPGSWMLAGLVPIGLAMVALQVLAFHVAWWAGAIAVVMSFAIGLVVARAAGETDFAPAGALGKVMQLVFAVISPPSLAGVQASVTQNVFSAGIANNSAVASAELLSDLKTGYLLGANPRKQFVAQLLGVAFGTLVCVPAWYLLIPNMAALEKFPAPASQIWVAMAKALAGGLNHLPMTILYAVLVGALVGIVLPILERLLPSTRRYLPSATGLGLGWVTPFSFALSFAIGAVLAWVWRLLGRASEERYGLPIASGLVAGEATVKAALAMLASAIGLLT